MSSASELFTTLQNFRSAPSPEASLLNYCKNTLGALERVHFDFKEKADRRKSSLDDADRRNLGKALSGFANSNGGVLIWGIEDASGNAKPIADVTGFTDAMLQMCHQVTSPAISGIDGTVVPSDSDPSSGYSLIYVPESETPPHRVLLSLPKVKDHYFIRAGSSFSIASHAQLEDMFGRRPQPRLKLSCEALRSNGDSVGCIVYLENEGRGIARFPYAYLEPELPYGISPFGIDGSGKFLLQILTKRASAGLREPWDNVELGGDGTRVVHAESRLAIARAESRQNSGKIETMKLNFRLCAEGMRPHQGQITVSVDDLMNGTAMLHS